MLDASPKQPLPRAGRTAITDAIARLCGDVPHAMLIGVIVLVVAVTSLIDPRIIALGNLSNIAVQTSYLAMFAIAQTIVILTRGFDLSLGVTVSVVSVVSALIMAGGSPVDVGTAIVAGLAAGVGVGAINGLLIAVVGINPLVTTLGSANVLLALATTISGGFPVPGVPATVTHALALGHTLGVPTPLCVGLLVFGAVALCLRYTAFGRSLYLIGDNARAARAAGIPTVPVALAAYTLCSVIAALGALLLTARTGSGEPNLGGNLTLESIAAAVVGGVRLTGGEGGAGGAVLGALFVTLLSNVMNLMQIDGYLQQTLLGLIILASLVSGRDRRRR